MRLVTLLLGADTVEELSEFGLSCLLNVFERGVLECQLVIG